MNKVRPTAVDFAWPEPDFLISIRGSATRHGKGNKIMRIKIQFAALALLMTVICVEPVLASETNTNNISLTVNVPGTANPWLAGMPDGTIAGNGYDVAPDQSPVQIQGIPSAGVVFTFSVTGGVSNDGSPLRAADGNAEYVVSRHPGAENGIADLKAPIDALVGVFLDDTTPGDFTAPAGLDFGSATNRDFIALSPGLRQPFFIGTGKTSAGVIRTFAAPAGATRLFLGAMDSWEWCDNRGSFTVSVTVRAAAGKE
jgi:hypothetical protein